MEWHSYEFVGGPADGHVQIMQDQPAAFFFSHEVLVAVGDAENEDLRHIYDLASDGEHLYYHYRGLE